MGKKLASHENNIPHVLIFPLPIQSPVNSMLKLAEIFCLSGFRVTFLNSEHNQKRLDRCTDVRTRFAKYNGLFEFLTIADGLPEDNPRSADQFSEIFKSLENEARAYLKKMLIPNSNEITCFVADGLFYYVADIAEESGIPIFYFDTISPCCLWTYLSIPDLIQAAEIPIKPGNDLNSLVTSVRGMEGFLRSRDLPRFCREDDLTHEEDCKFALKEIEMIPRAKGLILNSFQELDSSFLPYMHTKVPRLYAIGPLQNQLKARLIAKTSSRSCVASSSNSFYEEDLSSMNWLDDQPKKSVLFVSFGSLRVLKKEEFWEFWHGVVNSEARFLWVIRANSVKDEHDDGDELFVKEVMDGMPRDRGYIVRWAPQEKVLAHPAIGGFLTHSGWNSTLESITEGVPMICWPTYVDQNVTSRFVGEVWKIGLDMKDSCDRFIVEKMVRGLMKSDVYRKTVLKLSQMAKASSSQGGSSWRDLDCLLNDIKESSRRTCI